MAAAYTARRRLAGLAPAAAATAAVSTFAYMSTASLRLDDEQQSRSSKLPIYSAPPEDVILAEVRGPLEDQVAAARRAIVGQGEAGVGLVRRQIDGWIGVERAVENRVSSLIPNDEPITPGIFYVGIATLAGSVFTRYRAWPLRFLTPPLALVASLNYFLPKTAHNVGQYYVDVERERLPAEVGEQRRRLQNALNNTRHQAGERLEKARDGTGDLVKRGLQGVEQNTGLKVGGSGGSSAIKSNNPVDRMV